MTAQTSPSTSLPLFRGLAAIIFAVLLGFAVGQGGFADFDAVLAQPLSLRSGQSPDWLIAMMQAISWVGGGLPRWILVTVAAAVLWRFASGRAAFALALSSLLSNFASTALKAAFARPRPDFVPHLDTVGDFAFPSGHATSAAVVYLLLALLVPARWQTPAIAFAVILICLSDVSRIMLGVHWPTDVLGGTLLGAGFAMVAAWWVDRPQLPVMTASKG